MTTITASISTQMATIMVAMSMRRIGMPIYTTNGKSPTMEETPKTRMQSVVKVGRKFPRNLAASL